MDLGSRHTCTCGRRYDADDWTKLPLFAQLSGADLSALVTPWPPHVVVQIRSCSHCGRKLSRLSEREASRRSIAA